MELGGVGSVPLGQAETSPRGTTHVHGSVRHGVRTSTVFAVGELIPFGAVLARF
jgi:hypothetical protein